MELKAEKLEIESYITSKVVLECIVMISNPCGCKFKFEIYDHIEYEQHVKTVALMDPGGTLMQDGICCDGHFWYTAGEVKTALRKLTGSGSLEVENSGEGPYKTRKQAYAAMHQATLNGRRGGGVITDSDRELKYATFGYEIFESHPMFAGNRAIFFYHEEENEEVAKNDEN